MTPSPHGFPDPDSEIRPSASRRMGLPAMTISLLIHGIFIILAIFYFYKWIDPPEPKIDFLPGGGGGGGNGGTTAHKVQTRMHQMTSTSALSRKVTVDGVASFSLPDPSDMADSALPMDSSVFGSSGSGGGGGGGHGGGMGTGIGSGTGPGAGPGTGRGFGMSTSPFGSKELRPSALKGYLYDLKQGPEGTPTKGAVTGMNRLNEAVAFYGPRVSDLVRKNFRDDAFKEYFRAPDALYLSNLAVPRTNASEGPKLFGGEGKIEPSGWLAHYRGRLKAPRAMQFRFVGFGDDFVMVRVDRRVRLVAAFPNLRRELYGRWEPTDTDKERDGIGWKMTNGDWISLRAGQTFDFDITVGECPGGHVALLLMVEERRANYRTGRNGFPVLPIFTTEPISPETQARISRDFGGGGNPIEFEWDKDKVPVFLSSEVDDRFSNPFR